MTLETMSAVVADLNDRGIEASLEYPGSIRAAAGGKVLVGGDANASFCIDVCEGEAEDVIETVKSTIPSDSTDVKRIADHFSQTHDSLISISFS